ncbi:MAG: SH3 domain-containing protein, partial [Boseongicola sp.]
MFRLIAATVVAIFTVLLVFGDETRREDVSLGKRGPAFEFSLASFIQKPNDIDEVALDPVSANSEVEAVKIAVEAGELLRAKRNGTSPEDVVATVSTIEPTASRVDAAEGLRLADFWYVSGTRVNLRAGPGTANSVVARLGMGTEAEVLSDTAADWIKIR